MEQQKTVPGVVLVPALHTDTDTNRCIIEAWCNETWEEDALFNIKPPPPKIKKFCEAMDSLEDAKSFLDRKKYGEATQFN